jgi:WD40 repeat protein
MVFMQHFKLTFIICSFVLSSASLSWGMREEEKKAIAEPISIRIGKGSFKVPFGFMYSISEEVHSYFEEESTPEGIKEQLKTPAGTNIDLTSIEFDEKVTQKSLGFAFKELLDLDLLDEKKGLTGYIQDKLFSEPYLYCALVQVIDYLKIDKLLEPLVRELPNLFLKDPKLLSREKMGDCISKIQGPIKDILGSPYYPLEILAGRSSWINQVAWNPDEKQLASGSGDATIKIWDVKAGTLLKTLAGHEGWVTSVAWNPDGKWVASGSTDKTIKIWDVKAGTLLKTLAEHEDSVTSVAWNPDGKWVASGSTDETIKIWDVKAGTLLKTLAGHAGWVNSVAWSPDGKWVASGSGDKTIKIWDVKAGTLLKTLAEHQGIVNSVAWNPDGKWVASLSLDKRIKIWGRVRDAVSDDHGILLLNVARGLNKENKSIVLDGWSADAFKKFPPNIKKMVGDWNVISPNIFKRFQQQRYLKPKFSVEDRGKAIENAITRQIEKICEKFKNQIPTR